MSGDTALTAGLPEDPAHWAERDRKRIAAEALTERVRVFAFEILLDGYREGATSFEDLLRSARQASRQLPPFEQRHVIGALALSALDTSVTPRSGRGRPPVPTALRGLASELVQLVREHEGLPTKANAEGKATCFERVAELLAEFGIAKDARTIEAWAARRS